MQMGADHMHLYERAAEVPGPVMRAVERPRARRRGCARRERA